MADKLSAEFIAVHTVEDNWYMDALAEVMDEEGDRLIGVLMANAPVATGALRSSITTEIQPDGMIVRAGQDYGTFLDVSVKYHYLSGGQSGEPTQGWFSEPVGQFPESIMTPWVRLIRSEWDG
jgi:hypothetical protein